jgi:hypothetical protein
MLHQQISNISLQQTWISKLLFRVSVTCRDHRRLRFQSFSNLQRSQKVAYHVRSKLAERPNEGDTRLAPVESHKADGDGGNGNPVVDEEVPVKPPPLLLVKPWLVKPPTHLPSMGEDSANGEDGTAATPNAADADATLPPPPTRKTGTAEPDPRSTEKGAAAEPDPRPTEKGLPPSRIHGQLRKAMSQLLVSPCPSAPTPLPTPPPCSGSSSPYLVSCPCAPSRRRGRETPHLEEAPNIRSRTLDLARKMHLSCARSWICEPVDSRRRPVQRALSRRHHLRRRALLVV